MLDRQTVLNYYNYFYGKIYKIDCYEYTLSESNKKTLEKFITSVYFGENELFLYMCFTFNNYPIESLSMKRIMFNWIIGKKMIDSYRSRATEENIEKLVYWLDQFKAKYDIKKNDLISNVVSFSVNDLSTTEERFKVMYNDSTDRRLKNCILNTTLYNKKSDICSTCKLSNECIIIARHKYPNLIKTRR